MNALWYIKMSVSYLTKKVFFIMNLLYLIYQISTIYDFGFGINNIITKNEQYIKIAKVINKHISIQICKEVKDEVNFLRKYFIDFNEEILIGENKKFFISKKKLLKSLEIPEHMNKNIYIILSNSTTTKDVLHTFKEGSLIVHSMEYIVLNIKKV